VLNQELGQRSTAGEYSIADIATYPGCGATTAIMALEDYPNVKRWYDQIGKRPAVQRGMEIPKK
jgi:GST-like protein